MLDYAALLESYELHLRGARRSPQTVRSYGASVRAYIRWIEGGGTPADLSRQSLSAFMVWLTDQGLQSATLVSRHLGVRRFSAWLATEGEIDVDELAHVRAPRLDEKVVEPLLVDEVRAMIQACAGRDLRARRDEAIIRLMYESFCRASEVVGMEVDDIDLRAGIATIRRGKGGRGRLVPIGPQTGTAIDRYKRLRRSHRLADSPALWLGDRGKEFGYQALYRALCARAEQAGVAGFHPHRLRHTGADQFLDAGGSESGAMAIGGWRDAAMMRRYTKRRAEVRAIDEARRLAIGDI